MAKTAVRRAAGSGEAASATPSLFAARSRGGESASGDDVEAGAEATEGPLSLTLARMARAVGVDVEHITELQRLGMITPVRERAGAGADGEAGPVFDEDALLVARTAAALADYGIPARNLRMFKVAADREAGVYEQLLAAVIARGDTERLRAELTEIVDLTESLRRLLLQRALRPHLD